MFLWPTVYIHMCKPEKY